MYSSLSPKELPRYSRSPGHCLHYLDQANTIRCWIRNRTSIQISTLPCSFSATSSTVWLLLIVLFVLSLGQHARGQNNETTLAVVNDKRISQADVDQAIASKLLPLEQQMYVLRKAALENLIIRAILEAEASRLGISLEQLRERLSTGAVSVSAKEVEDLYQENALVFAAMSADEAREKLRLDLEAQARLRLYRKALAKLKATAKIEVLFEEPRLRFLSENREAPSRGPQDAPVTITEFLDFQCPYCKTAQATIRQILKAYPKEVRLVFRHLPSESHSWAKLSSVAALCAGEQDSFWPYHDALFENVDVSTLSAQRVEQLAEQLGLDLSGFKKCLSSEKAQQTVEKDIREARQLGIHSTPSFVINGRLLRGVYGFETFRTIIQEELKTENSLNSAQSGLLNRSVYQ